MVRKYSLSVIFLMLFAITATAQVSEQVLPSSPNADMLKSRPADIELLSNQAAIVTGGKQSANFDHVLVGQLGAGVILAFSGQRAGFLNVFLVEGVPVRSLVGRAIIGYIRHNMCPNLAKFDCADNWLSDSILPSNFYAVLAGGQKPVNFQNVGFGQGGIGMFGAALQPFWLSPRAVGVSARHSLRMNNGAVPVAFSVPTFPVAVGHVVSVRAGEGVIRVATNRIIARVAAAKLAWVNAPNKKIGQPVRLVLPFTNAISAVTVAGTSSSPWPAVVGAKSPYLRPESFNLLRGQIGGNRIRLIQSVTSISGNGLMNAA